MLNNYHIRDNDKTEAQFCIASNKSISPISQNTHTTQQCHEEKNVGHTKVKQANHFYLQLFQLSNAFGINSFAETKAFISPLIREYFEIFTALFVVAVAAVCTSTMKMPVIGIRCTQTSRLAIPQRIKIFILTIASTINGYINASLMTCRVAPSATR